MTKQSLLEPCPEILIESIRSIGYTFQSAIADIIDNSISAGAKLVNIIFDPINQYLLIFDNGRGMDTKELREAMRFGTHDPLIHRNSNDLGRFGLGLKSASFSQCREFVVVSKKNKNINAMSWNLNLVRETKEWRIIIYDDDQIKFLERIDLYNDIESGTYVLWKNFDRIEITSYDLTSTISNLLIECRNYLAIVFHKFISRGLIIQINGNPIPLIDPFLSNNNVKAQHLKPKEISIENKFNNKSKIVVTPHILPHISNLTVKEKELLGGIESLKQSQGFYIYRNDRLIIWGTWFRMVGNNELFKNARVEVEIPNTLDDIWNVDIKKSAVTIPDKIKKRLYSAVEESISGSSSLHRKRAINPKKEQGFMCTWNIYEDAETVSFKINRDLPIIKEISNLSNDNVNSLLEKLLIEIESNIPRQSIYTAVADGKQEGFNDNEKESFNRLIDTLLNLGDKPEEEIKNLINIFSKTEQYSHLNSYQEKVWREYLCLRAKKN